MCNQLLQIHPRELIDLNCPLGGVTTTYCYTQVAPLVHTTKIVLAAICHFHEAKVVAKNSSIQLRCLLDNIVPFYLDVTVYTTLYLAHGTHLQ